MQTINATYRVTTPMFLGGADPKQAELRLPSFKGTLRFWWRALAWDHIKDVEHLRREEAFLFGSSDEQVGQSKVMMRLKRLESSPPTLPKAAVLKDNNQSVGMGCGYLGYGVMVGFGRRAGELTRPCLLAPFTFTVELLFKPGTTLNQRQQIERALKALGLFGGLGSKSRKGYGSLTLTSLAVKNEGEGEPTEIWTPPHSPQDLERAIREILSPGQLRAIDPDDSVLNDLPDWTAFSPAARVIVLPAANQDHTTLAMLDRVGREMVRYRSWGRNGKILGREQREEIFKSDHDLMIVQRHPRRAHPKRVIFGLPHNYGKKEHHKEVEPESFDRRASPLFIHVHQASQGDQPVTVLSLLPSQFLPQSQSRISVGGAPVTLETANLWEPVETFLKRMLDLTPEPYQRKESFGKALEVSHG